jgi:hypothetical protein
MSEEGREFNPLLGRVDALLRRHQEPPRGIDDDVPVLTDVADPDAPREDSFDQAAVAELAKALELAVLERIGGEVDRLVEERLAKILGELLDRALRELQTELGQNLRQMLREAVTASVRRALAENRNPEGNTDVA